MKKLFAILASLIIPCICFAGFFNGGGGGGSSVSLSDTAYDATSWNGVTTVAPSKNAVRDKIEALHVPATITGDGLTINGQTISLFGSISSIILGGFSTTAGVAIVSDASGNATSSIYSAHTAASITGSGLTINAQTIAFTLQAGTDYLAPNGSGAQLTGVVKTETDPVASAITGLIKGIGSGLSASTAGVDYVAASALSALGIVSGATHFGTFTGAIISDSTNAKSALQELETYISAMSTSHDAATVTGSGLTISGQTISFSNTTINFVLAGPTTGGNAAPAYRALVTGDIPWASPGAIGSSAPSTGVFTTITATTISAGSTQTATISASTSGVITISAATGQAQSLSIDLASTTAIATISSLSITKLDFGSLILATTGAVTGGVEIAEDNDGMSQAEMTAAGMYGVMYLSAGSGTWNLPAAAKKMNFCFMVVASALSIVINPDDADVIWLDGVSDTAGHSIIGGSTVNDYVCFVSTDTTNWRSMGKRGTWTAAD